MSVQTPRTLFVVMMDVPAEHEAELDRWYAEEHLPERLACPGFKGATRFRGVDDPPGGHKLSAEPAPRYLAVYDLEGPGVVQTEDYRRLVENPTPWTQRMRQRYQVRIRHTYVELPPA
ncbi:MAG: hypothetical protein DLM67_20455 [Candidatus Nephthysia bennettiae]|uniref:DUF4286 family protein n=1 Tax=Candidatus Nephthysia bennettiae TaxID=3127016 RepID=A0A934KDT6_9BACT|nr:hypothetical protein [Candidatus Dormibacteraeota bacterium]MBJ7612402.1 hypothetical protein [Candidatus Dormibacteraeota bacterium]PZR88425.1 MAG: hypothetical protein DLM67_20455 [Candidatus Dormibacteraeota bacterium]